MLEITPSLTAPDVVRVRGGRFVMGSEAGRPDERPVREVEVRSFRLGRTAVTRRQYEPFLRAGAASPPPWWDHPAFRHPEQPVVGVTWHDAVEYAAWLGGVEGGR